MKRIIDGKRYDTETAALIGEAHGGGNPSDFRYWSEGLYQTKKGAYFLSGEGGPMSHYREQIGDSWGWGEGIIPLSNDEAFEWAQNHLCVRAVEAEFGEAIEDA